jgi:hypothetical protein
MNELDIPSREALVAHFLQGQTTVQMAAAQGVAQSTVSRRIERALEQLRDKLRTKGVLVALAALSAGMGKVVQAAPVSLWTELGKMAVTTSATAAGTTGATAWAGAKLAAVALATIIGAGGYLAYRHSQADRSPPAKTLLSPAPPDFGQATPARDDVSATGAGPVDPAANASASSRTVLLGADEGVTVSPAPAAPVGGARFSGDPIAGGPLMGFGGFGSRVAIAPSPNSPLAAVHRFATELRRGDMNRLQQCFVPGSAEFTGLKRLLENPQNDEERSMKQCLESLGQPVEVVETTPWEDGLHVKWKATVRKPFSLVEDGMQRTWQEGDKFELEVRLKKVGEDWRIAGF